MNVTNPCDQSEERLLLLLDDDTMPEEAGDLQAHLADCAVCRQRLQALRETLQVYGERKTPELPAGLEQRVRAALPRSSDAAALKWPRLARLAACLLPFLCLGVWFLASRQQTVVRPEPAVTRPPVRSLDFQFLRRRSRKAKKGAIFTRLQRKSRSAGRIFKSLNRGASKRRLFQSLT